MTGFAAPLALTLGLLAVPLVLLYLLKPRREERATPSTLLWRQALQETRADAPWQRLRRNLLLLLQLLALAVLVLALARPLFRSAISPGGDLVLVLDGSQSMGATDVAPSRWERARERVGELARDAGAGRRVALIVAGPAPRLLVGPTTQRGEVEEALRDLGAPHGELNLRDAALLARSVAGRLADATVLLVGDGGVAELGAAPLPHATRFDAVGGDGANAAVLGVSARSGPGGRQLWVSLGNYGPARDATLSLYADGELWDARRVALPANSVTGRAIDDAPPGAVVEARLDVEDALPADDEAWHVAAGDAPAKVLLMGEESRFLERALELLPGAEVFKGKPGAPPEPGYDVYVINGAVPARLPAGNLLLLGPRDSPLLPVAGSVEGRAVTSTAEDHAVLRHVDLSSVSVARAGLLAPPPWMQTLASGGDAPLLVVGENEGRRVAALAFTPEESDLPLQVAFPVLVDNLLRYLGPRGAAGSGTVSPGDPVALPASDTPLIVAAPGGETTQLPRGAPAFAATARPGVYEARNARGVVVYRFAVNAGSPRESSLGAGDAVPLPSSAGGKAGRARPPVGAERWWPLAAAALAVLCLEWWLYLRSGRRAPRRRPA